MYQLHHISHGKVAEATTWERFKKEIRKLPYPRPIFDKMEHFVKEGFAFSYCVNTLTAFILIENKNDNTTPNSSIQ